MTKIKNKQTGETLTGEIIQRSNSEQEYFWFRIKGTVRGSNTELSDTEWEILPPPLPTGIGAVVKDALGRIFVRIDSGALAWFQHERERHGWSDNAMSELSLTILSEGVKL